MIITKSKWIFWSVIIPVIMLLIMGLLWNTPLPGDYYEEISKSFYVLRHSALHIIVNILLVVGAVMILIIGLVNGCDDKQGLFTHNKTEIEVNWSFKRKYIGLIITILVCLFLYKFISPVISNTIGLYNQSIVYQNNYKQKTDEKLGFYDKLWKVYLQKNQIATLNRDAFLEVTKLIMEGRADGSNVAWKWVQENQQIPYAEFTKFYSDLSDFVFSQREAYFKIEQECMAIANANNTMLDTFPNNMYNKIVNCKRIEFEYSFTSAKTKEVFRTGEENLE